MPLNLCNIATLKIKNADYCAIITGLSKSEAINLKQNIGLTEKLQFWSYKFPRNSNLNKKNGKL